MPPLVSILIVVYNSSQFLKETIESVLNCSYTHLEILICDDNSTDNSWEIIKSFKDSRIKAIRNEINLGEYENRFKCVSLAKGAYFIFVDGDDLLCNHGLGHAVKLMEEYKTTAFGTVRPELERFDFDCKLLIPVDSYYQHYLGRSPLNLSLARNIFRTEIVRNEFKNFPKNIISGDDYIRLCLALNHNILLLKHPFAKWRKHPGQATERKGKTVAGLLEPFLINNYFLYNQNCPLTKSQKNIARKLAFKKIFRQCKQCIKHADIRKFIKLIGILKYYFGSYKGKGLKLGHEV